MSYRQFDDERKVLPDLEINPDLSEVVQDQQQDCSGEACADEPQEHVEERLESEDIFVGVKEDKIEKLEPDPVEPDPVELKTRGKDKAKRKKREFTPKMAEQLKKSREVKISKYRQKKAEALEKMKEDARQEGIQRYLKQQEEKKKQVEVAKKEAKKIAPVGDAPRPSFDAFCDLMDKYHSYKESKKQTTKKQTTAQPHPNKIVKNHHLPRPPLTQPHPAAVNVPSLLQVQNTKYNKWVL